MDPLDRMRAARPLINLLVVFKLGGDFVNYLSYALINLIVVYAPTLIQTAVKVCIVPKSNLVTLKLYPSVSTLELHKLCHNSVHHYTIVELIPFSSQGEIVQKGGSL